MLFDDVDLDALERGAEPHDRALFACVERKGSGTTIAVDEAWSALADRYPADARLRVLAIAREIEAHGVDEGRAIEDYQRAIDALAPRVEADLHAAFEALSVFLLEARQQAPDDAFRRARRLLRRLEQGLLEEAAARTAGDRPFAERSSSAPAMDDATLLARASGEVRPYSPRAPFAVGERLSHVKFGVGLVVGREDSKIEVVFAEGRKKLACA